MRGEIFTLHNQRVDPLKQKKQRNLTFIRSWGLDYAIYSTNKDKDYADMQETKIISAWRLKKNKFYQIVFSIGEWVSNNELPNLLKVKRFAKINLEQKKGAQN